MKAVLMRAYGGPEMLSLGEAPAPSPADDELLIRVAAVGVNPADAKWRSGMFQAFVPLSFPHILGYDVAGVVEQAPAGSMLQPGTRVGGMLDSMRQGAYAELAVVRATDAAIVSETLGFEAAAAVPTPGLTGVQMIEEHLDLGPGQTVLVTGGAGFVGRFAIWAAKARGARVVAAGRSAQRQEMLDLGADAAITLGEAWAGEPFSSVADTVGGPEVAGLCRRLAPGGRIVTVATTPIPTEGLSAQPTFFAVHPDGPRLTRLLQAVADGAIRAPVAETLPLAAAAAAQARLDAGGAGKIILNV